MRFVSILLLLVASAFSQDVVKPESLGYKLVWSDDFNGTALDGRESGAPTTRRKSTRPGTNNEKQSHAPENVRAARRPSHSCAPERKARAGFPFTRRDDFIARQIFPRVRLV